MRFYSVESFSDNIKETPEGFLACEGVAIARVGTLKYLKGEVPLDAGADGVIEVERSADVLFSPECLASFEGKPITLNHPPDFVTPETWRDYAVGTLQNVRGDGDFLRADLLITDENAIKVVKNKELRELSCGYEADYEELKTGRGCQTKIIGNHVALVSEGRCGGQCAIFDAAPKTFGDFMKEKLKKLLGRAIDEAPELEGEKPAGDSLPLEELVKELQARIEALEGKATDAPDAEPTEEELKAIEAEEKAAADSETEPVPDDVENTDAETEPDGIEGRLNAIESLLKDFLARFTDEAEPEKVADEGTETETERKVVTDAATLTAGAILAPNLSPRVENYAQKALSTAYATADGKACIDSILGGRDFAVAQNEPSLFFASAELLKQKRRAVLDAMPAKKTGLGLGATPEQLNDFYANFYKKGK